ncbi:MAG: hypothetical protein M3R17_05815 [Bacteroidota bacterium]|nr:hypothetical protein [Bacteroidota bacterium]
MKTVTLTLTLEETNLLFKSLGKMPFEQVYALIGKMNEQANTQLSGKTTATPFIAAGAEGKNGDGY